MKHALPNGRRTKKALCLILLLIALVLSGCGARVPARGSTPLPPIRASANDVLFRAISLVGTPYRYGGNTPQGGFDCSGLIGYVFSDVAGARLPRSADGIADLAAPKVPREQLASGDLVFFRDSGRINHIGIYVGEGRFVHAPSSGGTVRLDALDGDYWRDHYAGAKRVLQ
ncbi:C40 family peptidase [Tahibacter harae]|uniref:C40 family peptidase n=1 Tax=Tahibacter harae TaxID=2963937 RepID=A0ABT1QSU4_9GAMM|nr:C40 family peptidase [Tahibacter harae]MCQ4165339.1 C40 family peptidase [Tahibacter harae]